MLPKTIPIKRIKDYHTHYVGKTEDGKQFLGYIFSIFPEGFVFPDGIIGSGRKKYFKVYVVLHIFDKDGNYLMTNHLFAGTVSETNDFTRTEKLEQLINELGEVKYIDIKVKPFETIIDGVVFGLIPNKDYEAIDLQPNSAISFHEPWDGEYDT